VKKLYLLGHPVSHSLSPIMQNAAIQHFGLDWHYETLDVPPENLVATLEELEADPDVIGCNVTVPHKVKVYEWLGESRCEPEAIAAHAVNTLFKNVENRFRGDSTDASGGIYAMGIEAPVGPNPDLRYEDIAILGTGGSASTFGFRLARAPIHPDTRSLIIFGRTPERGSDLANRIREAYPRSTVAIGSDELGNFAAWNLKRRSLVIQTTTVGMASGTAPGQSPVPSDSVHAGQMAFDLVYNPHDTPFLQYAAANGAKTVHGIYMLVAQGALAFKAWIDASGQVGTGDRFFLSETMAVMRSALGV
jgi:shikimate dehydrogenase